MMTGIRTHQDERIPIPLSCFVSAGRAREAAHVADGVAGGVEEVEAAVGEVVVGGEAAEG